MSHDETVLFTATLSFLGSLVLATSWLGHEDLSSDWFSQELHLLPQVCQVFCKIGLLYVEDLRSVYLG
jgi:hypothetical protein